MHCAALDDRVEIMKLLVKHGADINARNIDSETPLDLLSDSLVNYFIQNNSTSENI